ncbi:O-methyltransferase [Anditalea andensis]|uniref:O-methyltransferase n=1 Tax=Anditalea andensis TaxID=1048983 RepID=UPI00068F0D7A|nr:class I SAM-dependent methyltransferase [Anditalea andensis]
MHDLIQYIKYFFLKEDRHSIQSPLAYKIYDGLLAHKKHKKNPEIETIRKKFLMDNRILPMHDLGAGSKKTSTKSNRTLKKVAKYSNSPKKFNLLYQYFLSITPSIYCVELGTGVGLNAAYLSAYTTGRLITIEGDPTLYDISSGHLKQLKNVSSRLGDIDILLPQLIKELPHIDFILIDANHTYDATMAYFHMLIPRMGADSIIIIGDIYWSPEMTKAWKEIMAHPLITLSFDFYECGVLFFKPNISRAHYIMDY